MVGARYSQRYQTISAQALSNNVLIQRDKYVACLLHVQVCMFVQPVRYEYRVTSSNGTYAPLRGSHVVITCLTHVFTYL